MSVTEVEAPGHVFEDDRVSVDAIKAHHGHFKHAYGYKFTTADRVVVIAGDGRSSPEIREASRDVDLLFHEVSTVDDGPAPWGAPEVVWAYHTGTTDLVELANDAAPKMLVLYHTQNWHQPYDEERLVKEMIRKGYRGKVVESRDTDVFLRRQCFLGMRLLNDEEVCSQHSMLRIQSVSAARALATG